MRSDQIHRALAHGISRFKVCQLVSKGVRATHKPGSRFEDSINNVLESLRTYSPAMDDTKPALADVKSLKTAA